MIVVLSMPQDRCAADTVVDTLVAADQIVWGETASPGGTSWSAAVVRAHDAQCLVICWSEAALADTVEAQLFRQAALDGCSQGRAIGVQFEHVEPPAEFVCTIYDLSEWRLNPPVWRKWLFGNVHLLEIVAAAKSKQANRDPRPPSALGKLVTRRTAILASAILVPLVSVVSFADVVLSLERRMATQPSTEEQAAWDALPAGDCSALRAFVRQHNEGTYRDRANAILEAAEPFEKIVWSTKNLDEELYLPHFAGSRESDAQEEGVRRCEMLIQGTGARNLEVTTTQVRQNCQAVGSESLCDWRGIATCSFEEPESKMVEICSY